MTLGAKRFSAAAMLCLAFTLGWSDRLEAAESCPIQPLSSSTKLAVAASYLNTCEPGGEEPPPPTTPTQANNMRVGEFCYLPGPHADDRCTVSFNVWDNPANNIICIWSDNALIACEGRTHWGGGIDWIGAAGATVEFRQHTNWPTLDPAWPNAELVRSKGVLRRTQQVVARRRVTPAEVCSVTVMPGQSLHNAINAGYRAVCLGAGIHDVASTLYPKAGQIIRSASSTQPATIRPAGGINVFHIETAGVTLKDFIIDSVATARPVWGVLVAKTNNVMLDGVKIYRAQYSLGVTEGASNVELRNSEIINGGDGLACSGCAHPSIWINSSTDVRVVKSVLSNNGVGPEGDGELACYNSTDVVVQNSSILNSGASGMYLVNCDRVVAIGNLVKGSKEWGLDIVAAAEGPGTDFGFFQWNRVEYSRNGGGVLKSSHFNTFLNNTYTYNRQGPDASGSCNGINKRGYILNFWQYNDTATPWPVSCSDN